MNLCVVENVVVQKWKSVLALELIEYMIHFSASERPNSEDVLKHPLFWRDHKIFDFFQVFFEFMAKADNRKLMIKTNIETESEIVITKNWVDVIRDDFEFEHANYCNYQVSSMLKCIKDTVNDLSLQLKQNNIFLHLRF